MKNTKLIINLLAVLLISSSWLNLNAQETVDISGQKWFIWLDKEAKWENDELFLPPVEISTLPTNAPTVGWEALASQTRQETQVPATVEEYFWGQNGNAFGVSGNYVGVSWFSTELDIPSNWKNKRIVLNFESVRLRAEIYVDSKLAGYDMINGTSFSVDISSFVSPGKKHRLDVRITDPNGNFAWRDWETYLWGKYEISPSHGFGGITGKVVLEATDKIYISDVFIKNKPELNKIDVETSISKIPGSKVSGRLKYTVKSWPSNSVVMSFEENLELTENSLLTTSSIELEDAKLWTPENPNLYVLEVLWMGDDDSYYQTSNRFGFRYFEVREVDGDRQFYLNGKRSVFRSAISWGHWPVNGIYPSDELAKKQIEAAKALGLNTLNFHRGIGQHNVLNFADELGLMYYAEPGGYRPGEQSDFTKAFKRERLLRMVKMFRNHPSLVIYNMINESNRDPKPNEVEDIQLAHKLDETRCITFASTFFGKNTYGGKAPFDTAAIKMFMLPYDSTVHYYGWWDEHHAGGPGVYRDEFYNSPNDIYRHYNNPKEIIVLGEEGAIGTPPRLQLIKEEYDKTGKLGWDGDTYLAMYYAYEEYLKNKGFTKAFPSVDALTQSLSNVSHYYQGRVIENCRIGNLLDGYVVNGWENTKVENHSGVVDIYRNLKTEAGIMAYYNQPLYVAVKMRNKVFELGTTSIADFFIVNENDINGKFNLKITAEDDKGVYFEESMKVTITGGHTYGELLKENIQITPRNAGYSVVKAQILNGKEVVAEGEEKLYAVSLSVENLPEVIVADTSGDIQKLLDKTGGIKYTESFVKNVKNGQVLMVGKDIQPGSVPGQFRQTSPMMDWVSRGNTLLITDGIENWCTFLSHKEILDYRGIFKIGRNWFGGNYFVKDHPFFDGLPKNTAFNWEYQFLAAYKRNRIGMRLRNGQTIVGITADHKREVFDAVVIIPHGNGKIILSALDLQALVKDKDQSNVAAKRILKNFIAFGK